MLSTHAFPQSCVVYLLVLELLVLLLLAFPQLPYASMAKLRENNQRGCRCMACVRCGTVLIFLEILLGEESLSRPLQQEFIESS